MEKKINEEDSSSNSPWADVDISRKKAYLAVSALSCGTLAFGMNEFVIPGFLPDIAETYSISIEEAAWVTTSFMISASISSPLMALGTVDFNRKYLLSSLMSMLLVAASICAWSPTFGVLILGRVIAGVAHASYMGIGSTVAGALFPESIKGSAVSMFFGGLSFANIIGVPTATFLGEKTQWRYAFFPIIALAFLSLVGIALLVPKKVDVPRSNVRNEISILKKPALWMGFAISAFGYSGMLASHTYFAKMMTELAGFSSNDIYWLTAVYGLGTVLGNAFGGKMADLSLGVSVKALLATLASVLVIFYFVVNYKIPAVFALFANGFVGFSLISPLMGYSLSKAPSGPSLAASTNISAFGVGIGLGIYLSGLAIQLGYGYASPNIVGAMLTTIGLCLSFFEMGRERWFNKPEYIKVSDNPNGTFQAESDQSSGATDDVVDEHRSGEEISNA